MYTQAELNSASSVIAFLAAKHGVPDTQIRAEIQNTIGYAKNNPDPSVRAIWRRAGFSKDPPTIEEFVVWITKEVKERIGLI